ncbi:GNAT family N-acetyltransferase [Sphingomonas sp. LR61]|uniref:GNAT family N-acetyltransferase n=1 Tax=Sphingomonas sp. LR61 TaxID=3050234 RepID=UPI002FE29FE5
MCTTGSGSSRARAADRAAGHAGVRPGPTRRPDPVGHRGDHRRLSGPGHRPLDDDPTPYREQDARTFVDALVGPGWASDREYTWAIRRRGSTWLEGIIGYRTAGRDLGFWLAPSARGAGLMHDAVELVVDWAFEDGARDVYWECYEGNTASAAVARSAGFSFTGAGPARIPGRDGGPTTAWTALRRADGAPASDLPWPDAPSRSAP